MAQALEIRRLAGPQLDHDDPRHREVAEAEPVPSHGSSSRSDSALVKGCVASTPRVRPREVRGAGHIRLRVALDLRSNLDRHLPSDRGAPLDRTRRDEFRAAGTESRKEGEDPDDRRKGPSPGRVHGDERRVAPKRGRQRAVLGILAQLG